MYSRVKKIGEMSGSESQKRYGEPRPNFQRLVEKYPVDEVSGAAFSRREANRARLLHDNSEAAAAFTGRQHSALEKLEETEAQEQIAAGIAWLEREFRTDISVRLILAASKEREVDFKSNRVLADVCGLTLRQVTAAKQRLKYAIKKVGAESFDEFLGRVSGG